MRVREKQNHGRSTVAKMLGAAGLGASVGGLLGHRSSKLAKKARKKAKKARKKLRKAEAVAH
jgi:hypothetical protein